MRQPLKCINSYNYCFNFAQDFKIQTKFPPKFRSHQIKKNTNNK